MEREQAGHAGASSPTSSEFGGPRAYLLSTLAVGLAFAARVVFDDYLGPPYLTFFPAVMLSAMLGGIGPGLVATALSAVLAATWLLPALHDPEPASLRDRVGLAAFVLLCALLTLVADQHRRSRRQVVELEAARQAEARVRAVSEEAEATVRQGRNLLALFVEHAPAAIAMLDREMRYLAVSRRFLADYGLATQAVVGRSHYDLFPEVPERWREIHRRCLAGAVEKCEADLFPRADGHTDWVRWELRPWQDASGQIGGLVLFSEVVTERVELQRRTARAERVAALGTMAAGMSHEINNPLTYVVSGVSFAREQLERLPAPNRAAWPAGAGGLAEVLAALDEAAEGAARVRDLVLDLRAFATGQHTADVRCDLASALERASRVAHHAFVDGTNLRVDLPRLPSVAGSEAELVQLFGCLLVNAGQAKAAGPNEVRVSAAQQGSQVIVQVSDTGRGIPADVLPRLFEPFFTTKAVGQGRGLGLPVALGIAQGLGGGIEVQSTVGAGTTVTVTLPAAGQAEAR
jgi:PAS domain S-box-containing protein